ncbi:unnamed protein product [Closterium sp. Naga37s-1]|nr:unnamed protein product [Closterium sp. Naga37s-1]
MARRGGAMRFSPPALLPRPALPLRLCLCVPLLCPRLLASSPSSAQVMVTPFHLLTTTPFLPCLPSPFPPVHHLLSNSLLVAIAGALLDGVEPLGNLHGGVSALVTEAVGSLGAAVAAGAPVVGVEVACSHLRGAPIGTPLIAVGTPLRVGRTVQVWEVRLSASSDRVPAQQGEPAPASEVTLESTQKAAATWSRHLPSLSHSQSPDSKAGPSLEPQQQPLPPDCTPEGFTAGRLLAVGRLTCVALPQSRGGGANGENGNGGEAKRNGGGEKEANGSGGEASRREESGALGNREEGSAEAELKQRIGESKDEHEGACACLCLESPRFDSPPFNRLPIHKFIGLRFLSACPHRVVAAFVSSPATAQVLLLAGQKVTCDSTLKASPAATQPFNNVHGGVSAIVTETLGTTGSSLAAGGLVVGVEVAISHLRPCPLGTPVVAVAVPLRAGRTVQIVRGSRATTGSGTADSGGGGQGGWQGEEQGKAVNGIVVTPSGAVYWYRLAVGRMTVVVLEKGMGRKGGRRSCDGMVVTRSVF